MRGLKGKVAAVTGAGSGIGQPAATRLAEEACKAAVIDWKPEAPKSVKGDVKNIPMRCGAEPDEIAGAVAFLASDNASSMTGSAPGRSL